MRSPGFRTSKSFSQSRQFKCREGTVAGSGVSIRECSVTEVSYQETEAAWESGQSPPNQEILRLREENTRLRKVVMRLMHNNAYTKNF